MEPKELAAFEQRFTEVEGLKRRIESLESQPITGAGFSGTLRDGIVWDKKAAKVTTIEVPVPPDTGEYGLTSIDGVMTWTPIEDC